MVKFDFERGAVMLCLAAAWALSCTLGCSAAPARNQERADTASRAYGEARIVPGVAASEAPSPSPRTEKGGRLVAESTAIPLVVDVGDRRLGGYELQLRYDPATVSVEAVLPPPAGGFPGAPMANPSTFSRGITPVVGFHVGGPLPGGRVTVALVKFLAKKAGDHSVSVSVISLLSPEGEPIPGAAGLAGAAGGRR
ncbi:MAG: hypothetical protein ACYTFG_21500 [Planctomycetota bacterium]